jgi:hypothetical protein
LTSSAVSTLSPRPASEKVVEAIFYSIGMKDG